MKPRELELPALLERLINEHDEIKKSFRELSTLLFENKFLTVANKLEELKLIIDQHIIDEEAKILKFLLNTVSKEESTRGNSHLSTTPGDSSTIKGATGKCPIIKKRIGHNQRRTREYYDDSF
ncbi:MAG: hypothetical protein QXQ02_07575 [Halobacteria archaeon]